MPIPPELTDTYRTFWAIAQDVAQAKNADGSYTFQNYDLQGIVRDAYAAMGMTLSFQTMSQMPALFGLARANDRAFGNLAAADPMTSIDSGMVAAWPTAAPVGVQDVQPEYFARAEFTYINALGEQATGWVSLTGMTQLPLTNTSLYNQLQGVAMQQYSKTTAEGGSLTSDAELMTSFGEFSQVQLFAV